MGIDKVDVQELECPICKSKMAESYYARTIKNGKIFYACMCGSYFLKDGTIREKTINNAVEYIKKLVRDAEKYEIEHRNENYMYHHPEAFRYYPIVEYIKELEKYDIRKIELKGKEIEKAPSFTKNEIELMNLGIAIYLIATGERNVDINE